jgi:cytochrome c biogenesis protein CcmG/thiol:disulfide interchange protein DsbE
MTMKLIRFLPFILFVALAGIFAFILADKSAATRSPLLQKDMPAFSMTTYKSDAILDNNNIVKPSIMVFWASWCGICKINLPVVSAFAEKHAVPFYGVAYRDTELLLDSVMPGLNKNVSFTQLGLDETGQVSSQFGLVGVPTLFAITANGTITYVKSGTVSMKELERDVLPLLQ